MKNNNYASFFKTKPKKVEKYIRCRKCGGNMEWVEYYPPTIKCPKCGYTVYPKHGSVNFRKGRKGLMTKYGINTSEPVKKNSRYIYFEKEGDWINGKM